MRKIGYLQFLGLTLLSVLFYTCKTSDVKTSASSKNATSDKELSLAEVFRTYQKPNFNWNQFLGHISTEINDSTQNPHGNRISLNSDSSSYDLVEGDILVPKKYGLAQTEVKAGLWPDSTIPYVLDKNLHPLAEINFKKAAAEWMGEIPGLKIVPHDPSVHKGYLKVIRSKETVCSSTIGFTEKNLMTLGLTKHGKSSCSFNTIVHEIGHTLGLRHEQTRFDRDDHVMILWDNIDKDNQYNYKKLETPEGLNGAYDIESIMHYGDDYFCILDKQDNCKGPTMKRKDSPNRIFGGSRIGAGDIAAIKKLYPQKGVIHEKIDSSTGDGVQLESCRGDPINCSPYAIKIYGKYLYTDTNFINSRSYGCARYCSGGVGARGPGAKDNYCEANKNDKNLFQSTGDDCKKVCKFKQCAEAISTCLAYCCNGDKSCEDDAVRKISEYEFQ